VQFGKVLHPEKINFFLPEDYPNRLKKTENTNNSFNVHIGCAKWNRQDLKGFYPKGTKEELKYYSSQFNAIELNATFYNLFPKEQFKKWNQKTTADFKFYPKITRVISHEYELNTKAIEYSKYYIENVDELGNKLGIVFLQLHEDFSPIYFDRLQNFIAAWQKNIPLAIELRHTDWFNQPTIASELYHMFKENKITNIITDTAGRRDLLHMSLTNSKTFIRFVGANHITDYLRLEEWVGRIEYWKTLGVEEVNFFIHQNVEVESVKLSAYFIKKLNSKLGLNHRIPVTLEDTRQISLF